MTAGRLFAAYEQDGTTRTGTEAGGFDVHAEDVARLSPFVRHHVNVLGRYSFTLS